MKLCTKLTAAASVALCCCLSAGAAGPMTLKQCVDYALEHNINLQQQMLKTEQSRLQLETARKQAMPKAEVSVNEYFYPHYSISNGLKASSYPDDNSALLNFSPSVKASVPLYEGGRIRSEAESRAFDLVAETALYEAARRSLKIQVAAYYLQVLYYMGLEEVSSKQVETSRSLVHRAQALVDEGRRPESELAEARSQLAGDEYLLSKSRGNVLLSKMELAQLLDMEDIDKFDVADASLQVEITPSLDDLPVPGATFETIVDSYPSILASKAALEASLQSVRTAKSYLYPSVSLIASVPTNHYHFPDADIRDLYKGFGGQMRDLFNPVVGINLTYTICSGKQIRNNIRLAELAARNSELSLNNARLALRKELQQAYYNAATSVANFESAVKAEDASRISFEYTRKSYDAGRVTFFDLNLANQKWVNASNEVVTGRYEYLIRRQILEFYTENEKLF